jgi:hypothetical protein
MVFFIFTVVTSFMIATCYRLDGPGIESRWERDFSHLSRRPGAHPASYTMGTRSFLEEKRLGHGVDHPPPSSAEVKERVKLYLYSPSGPSWAVIG